MLDAAGSGDTIDIIYFCLGFAFFFLNLCIMGEFTRMYSFFIKILSVSQELSQRRAIALLVVNNVVIAISLFRYFVHGQLLSLIGMIDSDLEFLFYSSSGNLAFSRFTRYVSQACPFLIASTQVIVLSWFASSSQSGEDDDDESFHLNTTTIINAAYNQENCESLMGSIK